VVNENRCAVRHKELKRHRSPYGLLSSQVKLLRPAQNPLTRLKLSQQNPSTDLDAERFRKHI
jgi:hypothetical protein